MNGQNPENNVNNLNNSQNEATVLGQAPVMPNAGVSSMPTPTSVPTPTPTPTPMPASTPVPPPVAPVVPENNPNVANPNLGQPVNNIPNPTPVNVSNPVPPVPNTTVSNPMPTPNPGESTPAPMPMANENPQNPNLGSSLGMDPIENVNVNGFVEPPKTETIGTTPPAKETKKGLSKPMFIVLIVVLIIGVAVGVYAVLNMSKKKITITLKSNPVMLKVGDTVSTSVSDYATINGTDPKNCNLENINNVDTTVANSYTFRVVCGSEPNSVKEEGTIIVSESQDSGQEEVKPSVALKAVYKVVGDSVLSVDDFVKSCKVNDENCNEIIFANEEQVQQNLLTAGTYDVDIIVTDNDQKSTTVKAPLYVVDVPILFQYSCGSANTLDIPAYAGTKKVSDLLAIGQSSSGPIYLNAGRRVYTYVFTNEEDYQNVTKDHLDTITFDNITGLADYDDANLTLTISVNLTLDTLNSEAGGTFPTNVGELIPYYTNKGDSCSPILNN